MLGCSAAKSHAQLDRLLRQILTQHAVGSQTYRRTAMDFHLIVYRAAGPVDVNRVAGLGHGDFDSRSDLCIAGCPISRSMQRDEDDMEWNGTERIWM